MTREQAIEFIAQSVKSDVDMAVIADAIKALEQEPRWIPVSERYPKIEDEYKYFLVTDSKGKVSVQEFFISLDEDPQPYFSGMVDVIAWMPLPTPYKPQESEDKE
jgi:hypothetical protein